MDYAPLILISEALETTRIFADDLPEEREVLATEALETDYLSIEDQNPKVAIPGGDMAIHPAGVKGFSPRWVLFSWIDGVERSVRRPSGSTSKQETTLTPMTKRLEPGFLAAICQQLNYAILFGNRRPSNGYSADSHSLSSNFLNRTIREFWCRIQRTESRYFCVPFLTLSST